MTLFLVLLLALVVSTLVLALLLRLAPRTGLMDHPGERRRIHREAVPRVGGLAIFAGLLASLVVAPPLTAAERYGLAGAALLVLVGALDDRYQLGPRVRLLAQLGAALLLTLGGGVVLTSLGDLLGTGPLGLGAWALPVTLVAVVGLINALNMIDGIDGLAAGVTLIGMGSLLPFLPTGSPLALLLSATLVALVPYLVGNLELGRCRCKVFLGDAGSMLLGYLLVWGLITASRGPAGLGAVTAPGVLEGLGAVTAHGALAGLAPVAAHDVLAGLAPVTANGVLEGLAPVTAQGGLEGLAPVTALWLVAIPLMDTLAVMGRRLRNGQHPFNPDRGHLHHRLARLFHSPRRALILLLALALLLAGVGLAGQALAVPEALMFALALAVFGGYLAILYRWPDWHRRRLRLLRQSAPKAGG